MVQTNKKSRSVRLRLAKSELSHRHRRGKCTLSIGVAVSKRSVEREGSRAAISRI